MGRLSSYTQEIADTICERVANGESLRRICSDDDMPGMTTVMRWAKEDAEFGSRYARAREAQAEVMDDLILRAAEEADLNWQAAKVKIEAYKWRAAKLAPKVYGDKMTTEVTGANGGPVEFTEIRRTIVDPSHDGS